MHCPVCLTPLNHISNTKITNESPQINLLEKGGIIQLFVMFILKNEQGRKETAIICLWTKFKEFLSTERALSI